MYEEKYVKVQQRGVFMSFEDDNKEFIAIKRKSLTKRIIQEIDDILTGRQFILLLQIGRCESPIEELFALNLFNVMRDWELENKKVDSSFDVDDCNLQSEFEVNGKKYRVDFFISCKFKDKIYKFAIECDGHDFHEKTKQQVARDKARERALQSLRINVIRFSGSEIWGNPKKCVREALDIISEQIGFSEMIRQEIDGWYPDESD